MPNEPLVTVNILSFNRKEELKFTLNKVFEQDYKNIEVIVVDNASVDGTQKMVKTEFPNVQLIELKQNIGIAGWNKGFEAANGEYVLVLDDDSYPESETISLSLNMILSDPLVAICACRVLNGARAKDETEDFIKPYNHFIGCGAIIRKNVFFEVGQYDENLFIYVHETDFAIRVIDKGYRIELEKDAIVNHRIFTETSFSPINNDLFFFYSTLNNLILNVKYLPRRVSFVRTWKYLVNRLLVALYFGYTIILFRVIVKFIKKKILHEIIKNIPNQETLVLFNFRRVPIFDRDYFGKLIKNKNRKILLPIRYLQTFFYAKKNKRNFIY